MATFINFRIYYSLFDGYKFFIAVSNFIDDAADVTVADASAAAFFVADYAADVTNVTNVTVVD